MYNVYTYILYIYIYVYIYIYIIAGWTVPGSGRGLDELRPDADVVVLGLHHLVNNIIYYNMI